MKPELSRSIAERAEIVGGLLEDLRNGSEQACRRLFELYYRPMLQFFTNRGFPAEDCLDLTQETFLRVYTGIGSFRAEAGFDTWLFTIAANTYRKRRRWKAAEKRTGEEVPLDGGDEPARPAAGDPVDAAAGPEEKVLERERVRLLREAIERMPEQMKRCLVLRLDQGLKYREIGVAMRLSTETVKAHLHQARCRLHEELGPEGEPRLQALAGEKR